MTKTNPTSSPGYRLCPTCGTRVGAAATKCLVCGTDLTLAASSAPAKAGQATTLSRRPISLLTVLIILVVVVLIIAGAGLVVAAMRPEIFDRSTATPTATATASATMTATPTPTDTPEPTATQLPLLDYTVVSGDTCIKIAFNAKVSVAAILTANGGLINADCSNLTVGTVLKVPQPTPTPSPLPSATLPPGLNTPVPRLTYTVRSGDTLAGIAKFYGLTVVDLMQVNGLSDPSNIRADQILVIPLERAITPGPTPTATQPPPYPAPQPLNPRDGEVFLGAETVSLQWAAVSQLRAGEFFQVIIEDVTANSARFLRDQVTDTKFIIPATFQPEDGTPHVYRWSVTTVRQRTDTAAGQPPVFDPAGAVSPQRSFVWSGPGGAAPSATPSP